MASSVDLGRQLEKFVSSLVSRGRYNSKSEVLREGLRLLEDRELARRMGEAGRERARRLFTWPQVVGRMVEVMADGRREELSA